MTSIGRMDPFDLQRLLGDYFKFCSLYQGNKWFTRGPEYETAEEIINLQPTLMLMKMNVSQHGEELKF